MDWGSAPDWVGGIGTVVALGWAVFLYRQSVREKVREGPRRVYALPVGEAVKRDAGQPIHADGSLAYLPGAVDESNDERGQISYRAAENGALHHVVVRNDSEDVITHVRLTMSTAKGEHLFKSRPSFWPHIEPDGERSATVFVTKGDLNGHVLYVDARPGVLFQDAVGRAWEHGLVHPLRQVRGPLETRSQRLRRRLRAWRERRADG